jgi:DNA-binding CsgD family transcriptional regulator
VSTVVGRVQELAAVEAFLSGDSGADALAIVGEAGIGKSTLWQEAVRRATERGVRVLRCRPAESEARLSFAGLSDLLSPVEDDVFVALPAPQRHALDVALLRTEAFGAPPDRRVVATALLSLLRALAAKSAVLVAVDDVQWLDPPSTSALAFAHRRLADEPIGALLSIRGEGARSELISAFTDERAERLVVGPLTLASLHRIVVDRLAIALPRPNLVRMARASGGNPFYVLEIARMIRDDPGRAEDGLPVPEDLRALVAARIAALPSVTQAALLRAAALARPDLSLVDGDALVAAEEAGLIHVDAASRIEFVHPLFASAVYGSESMSRRRATHSALANAVEDSEERARHLALACDGPNDDVAGVVEQAARGARARGAPDTAAELSELAVRLTSPGSSVVDERRLELAEHLHLAGDFEREARLLDELRETLAPGDLRARALLMLGHIDFWRAGESAALALADEALLVADDRLLLARCHALIAMWAGTIDVPKAARAAEAALAVLELDPAADPGLLALALSARVRADLFLGNGLDVDAAERARVLEAGALPASVDRRVVFKLGQWLRYVDDLDGARRRLAEAELSARDEGDESSLANILLNRVLVECWAGEWQRAAKLVERTGEALGQKGIVSATGDVWHAYLDAHQGRLDAVRAAADRATQPHEPIIGMLWQRCLGLAELANGESDGAGRHLTDAMNTLDQMDFREPAVWRVDGDAIEATVAVGHLERAEELVGRFEQRAARSRIPWSLAVSARCRCRCRGLVLAAQGELAASAEALARALVEHERSPVPFEHARTLLLQGQVLRRLKQKRQARESLEHALAIFRRLGAEPWAERTDEELRRVATRRAPLDLSATELQIAKLAASGLTNDAIAREVFVTRKTVEANLGRAYGKLGIRSRAQLARALDARGRRAIP